MASTTLPVGEKSAHQLAIRASATPGAEIIVVDDASTDQSAAVAEKAGVRVVRLRENAGPGAARNRAATAARAYSSLSYLFVWLETRLRCRHRRGEGT